MFGIDLKGLIAAISCAMIYEKFDEKYISPSGNISKDLNDNLVVQYEFLIGIGKFSSIELNPKGSDIMPVLDISVIDEKSLAEMLAIVHHFINKNDEHIQLKHRMLLVDLEKEVPMMDYLIERILPDKLKEYDEWQKIVKRNGYFKEKGYLNMFKLIYEYKKFYFRQLGQKENIFLSYMEKIKIYKDFINNTDIFLERICVKYPEYGKLGNLYHTWMYMDLCCQSILQYVIQGIIKNTENTDRIASIKRINEKILELIETEKQLPPVKLDGMSEEMLFKIYSFYFIRDMFLEDTKVLKYIDTEYIEEEKLNPEYSLKNFYSKRKKRTWDEVKNLFEEGGKCNIKTFKRNIANCYLLLTKLNRKNILNPIPCTPIRLKALYIAFYLDKTLLYKFLNKKISYGASCCIISLRQPLQRKGDPYDKLIIHQRKPDW